MRDGVLALPRKNGLVVKRFGGVFPQIHFHTVVVSSNHCSNAYAPGHSESQCIQTPLFVTPAHPETNGLRSLWPWLAEDRGVLAPDTGDGFGIVLVLGLAGLAVSSVLTLIEFRASRSHSNS